jgi:predicted alpha/beta hydrolase family esterase
VATENGRGPVQQSTIVIVPGLRGHVEEHWQTLLAARLPRVRTADSSRRDKRDLTGRVRDLQAVVEEVGGPVTIVAHSAGCLVTAHWARLTATPAGAALLATPPDLAQPLPAEYPSLDELRENGWLPVPLERLPFPSIVAGSSNDPLGEEARVRTMAEHWGSEFIDVGPVGHLNPASGYGEWPLAESLLEALDAMVLAGAADTDGALPRRS